VCGQYPGPVPAGNTVSVVCTNVCERDLHFRYVVVQFPLTKDHMTFCEIEVFTVAGKILSSIGDVRRFVPMSVCLFVCLPDYNSGTGKAIVSKVSG